MLRALAVLGIVVLHLTTAAVATGQGYTVLVSAAPYNAACNGTTDDAAAIAAALASVPLTGGTVRFPASGLCGVGSAGVTVQHRAKVVFEGAGPGAGLKALAPGPTIGAYGATMLRLIGCTHCRVSGLILDSGSVAVNALGVGQSLATQVRDNTLHNTAGLAALVSYANTGNRYEQNTVVNPAGITRGMWIGNSSPAELETEPRIHHNTITLFDGTALAVVAVGASIRGNTLTHQGGGPNGSGMALSAANGVAFRDGTVTDNTITGFPYHCIQSDASTDNDWSAYVTVHRNTLRQCLTTGVYVLRARHWTVSDNLIEDNGLAGIILGLAHDSVITGNLIQETRVGAARTQVLGIRAVAQTAPLDVQRLHIRHNTAVNHLGDGIQITNALPGTMHDVTLTGNVLLDNDGWGIAVTDAVDGTITKVVATGNITQRNALGTIRMDPSDGVIN